MTFLSAYEGAITTLYAATSLDITESPTEFKGCYMVPFGKITELDGKDARSEELARQLWETTESVVSQDLAKGSPPTQ
jgi:hypothetical protein